MESSRGELSKWLCFRGWLYAHVKTIIAWFIVAVLLTSLATFFNNIIGNLLPNGTEIACVGQEWIAERWPFRQSEVPADKFRILIAKLDGDDDKISLTHAVENAFHGQNAIDRVSTCRVLKVGVGPVDEATAAKTGLEWLARRKADVLVFGEVLPKGEALNLHFLSSGREPNFTATSFRLESGLLRDEFKEAMAPQLQAVVLAAVRPVTKQQGKYLVQTLRPVAVRLKRIADSPPHGMSMADIQFALGLALSVIGDQAGDNQALQETVMAAGLGNALRALGEREDGTETLQQAVMAYNEALKEWMRDRVPLQWAMTQQNLDRTNALLTQRRGK